MKLLFSLIGASGFAVLMYLCSTWYLQPLLVRQTVLRRLNRQSLMGRLVGKLPRRRKTVCLTRSGCKYQLLHKYIRTAKTDAPSSKKNSFIAKLRRQCDRLQLRLATDFAQSTELVE